jgi:hypothetical protein
VIPARGGCRRGGRRHASYIRSDSKIMQRVCLQTAARGQHGHAIQTAGACKSVREATCGVRPQERKRWCLYVLVPESCATRAQMAHSVPINKQLNQSLEELASEGEELGMMYVMCRRNIDEAVWPAGIACLSPWMATSIDSLFPLGCTAGIRENLVFSHALFKQLNEGVCSQPVVIAAASLKLIHPRIRQFYVIEGEVVVEDVLKHIFHVPTGDNIVVLTPGTKVKVNGKVAHMSHMAHCPRTAVLWIIVVVLCFKQVCFVLLIYVMMTRGRRFSTRARFSGKASPPSIAAQVIAPLMATVSLLLATVRSLRASLPQTAT